MAPSSRSNELLHEVTLRRHKKQCLVKITQTCPDADGKRDDGWLKPQTTDYNAFRNRKPKITAGRDTYSRGHLRPLISWGGGGAGGGAAAGRAAGRGGGAGGGAAAGGWRSKQQCRRGDLSSRCVAAICRRVRLDLNIASLELQKPFYHFARTLGLISSRFGSPVVDPPPNERLDLWV